MIVTYLVGPISPSDARFGQWIMAPIQPHRYHSTHTHHPHKRGAFDLRRSTDLSISDFFPEIPVPITITSPLPPYTKSKPSLNLLLLPPSWPRSLGFAAKGRGDREGRYSAAGERRRRPPLTLARRTRCHLLLLRHPPYLEALGGSRALSRAPAS